MSFGIGLFRRAKIALSLGHEPFLGFDHGYLKEELA